MATETDTCQGSVDNQSGKDSACKSSSKSKKRTRDTDSPSKRKTSGDKVSVSPDVNDENRLVSGINKLFDPSSAEERASKKKDGKKKKQREDKRKRSRSRDQNETDGQGSDDSGGVEQRPVQRAKDEKNTDSSHSKKRKRDADANTDVVHFAPDTTGCDGTNDLVDVSDARVAVDSSTAVTPRPQKRKRTTAGPPDERATIEPTPSVAPKKRVASQKLSPMVSVPSPSPETGCVVQRPASNDKKPTSTRRIAFAATNAEQIADFELLDVRSVAWSENKNDVENVDDDDHDDADGKNDSDDKKKKKKTQLKVVAPSRRLGPSTVVLLAMRVLVPQRLLAGESRSLSGNVHVKSNALNEVAVHVYGTNVLEATYGRSLIDQRQGGMTVVVRNLSRRPVDLAVNDVFGYVELRSLNDSLKLSPVMATPNDRSSKT